MVKNGKGRLYKSSAPTLRLIAQEDLAKPGQIMECFLYSKNWTEAHDADCAIHKAALIPAEVRRLILHALENGWDPAKKGKPFEITNENIELSQYRVANFDPVSEVMDG